MVALADVESALSLLINPRIARIMNRHSLLATILAKTKGSGKNATWDVEFTGATAETFADDGAAVTAFDADTTVSAVLSWARYRSNLLLTGLALAGAGSSPGPEELVDLFMEKAEGKVSALLSKLNVDIYTGGGTNALVGLQTALAATGTYAGLAQGTYTEWAGNVLANGAVPRPLTKTLLDQAEKEVYLKKGESPQILIVTPGTAIKFEALFDSATKNTNAPDLSPLASIFNGTLETARIPPVIVRNLVGYYKGMPVFRDKDCPTGQAFMLNLEEVMLELLPPTSKAGEIVSDMAAKGNTRDPSSGLNVRVEMLAKTGDASRWMMKFYPALKVRARNAHAWIKDIDET